MKRIDMKDTKFKEVITGMEDDIHYSFKLVHYSLLTEEDKENLINEVDFRINKNATDGDGKLCWKLEDKQEGNYANIEEDIFGVGDYDRIVDRLSNYFSDYGYIFLEEVTENELAVYKELV